MTTAYFDCYSGISGDMTLGALVDLGVPVEELKEAIGQLGVDGWEIESRHVQRCGIGATHIVVKAHDHHTHRHFSHIKKIIEASRFSDRVKQRAIDAFHRIAVAEAAVHETTVEKIHFHEVGAIDAIIDIIGSMWLLDRLEIDYVQASAVAVGSGTIKVAHGEMPVPAPATVRLLEGVPVVTGSMPGELTTPTGAAILTSISESFGPLGNFQIAKVGYGAGTREAPGQTNYLRVLLGDSRTSNLPVEKQELALVQTDIDDMSPEVFGYVTEALLQRGCLEVHALPAQMKKNRPGTTLEVLVKPDQVESTVEYLLRETTTFGVRVLPCSRYALRRERVEVPTSIGPVRVKLGYWGDTILKATPEYEDCRQLAQSSGIPLHEVFIIAQLAIQEWRRKL